MSIVVPLLFYNKTIATIIEFSQFDA